MGHIEDIAVHKDFNRMEIGNAIMNYLLNLAQEKNCYKISLYCHKNNIDFYKKFNFIKNGLTLTKFL